MPRLRRGTAAGGRATVGVATPVLDPAAADMRMHGKVFFRIVRGPKPGNYVCSGTAVNSRNRSLVMTAGHCVFDWEDHGGKVTDWAFVPAYNGDDARPYGTWPAKRTATTRQWRRGENLRYDLGAAIVRRNPAGRRLQAVVGARGIGFDQPRRQRYDIFGYPVEGAFVSTFEYALLESLSRLRRCRRRRSDADAGELQHERRIERWRLGRRRDAAVGRQLRLRNRTDLAVRPVSVGHSQEALQEDARLHTPLSAPGVRGVRRFLRACGGCVSRS